MAGRSGNAVRVVDGVEGAARRAFCAPRAWIGALFLVIAGCEKAAPERAWPPGTVLAIDALPISASEVAEDMLPVMLIETQYGEAQAKRMALHEITLPRAVFRLSSSEAARELARREVEEAFARVSGQAAGARPDDGILGVERSGLWGAVGLVAWGTAMHLEVGQWSELIEEPGAFLRVRLLERKDGLLPAATWVRLDTLQARYGGTVEAPMDEQLQRHRLTIVDPDWWTIVPERTQYLMGARR